MSEHFESAAVFLRFAVAFVFLGAALPKLFAPRAFEHALANYQIVPAWLVRPIARILPWTEGGLAIALMSGLADRIAAGLAAVLLAGFAGAVAVNLNRGRRIECGCFDLSVERKIGWGHVARNVVLVVAAAVVAVIGPTDVVATDRLALLAAAAAVVLSGLLLSEAVRVGAEAKAVSGLSAEART